MRTRGDAWWSVAGVLAGYAGLLVSYAVAMLVTIRDAPFTAIGQVVIHATPGPVAEKAIKLLGHHDKQVLVAGMVVISTLLFAGLGRLAKGRWWLPIIGYAALALAGAAAVLRQHGAGAVDLVAVAAGFAAWTICLSLLTEPLRRAMLAGEHAAPTDAERAHTRRIFLIRAAVVTVAAAGAGAISRGIGKGRRHVEQSRRLLKLDGVTAGRVPVHAHPPVDGLPPWQTPADSFYRIDTAFVAPTIEPSEWSLRIHGMVEREVTVTYADLLERDLTEDWITLNCVSNEVGGPLIGNAWWSGVRIAPLLAEAGIQPGADAVKQTSQDGWTCGTPLTTLTDDRSAMLAVAMNGAPLPIDHGFPVRVIVPGLYGYVSATKWVVDFEVTRFADFDAYWTQRGWSERGPVKLSSRIDVPRPGASLPAGAVTVAGAAWHQHTGIARVEVQLDGGAWQTADLGTVHGLDSWVQWSIQVQAEPGDHALKVRAIDQAGEVQTAVITGTLPDGSTGLHQRNFHVHA